MYKITWILIVCFMMISCQSVQDSLSERKKNNRGDEFLVKKKDPLTIPPDFENLPEPNTQSVQKTEEINLNKLFNINQEKKNKSANNKKNENIKNIENKILKEIKN